jgi:hypothetical protein
MFDLIEALPAGRYDFVRLCPVRDNETQHGVMGTSERKNEADLPGAAAQEKTNPEPRRIQFGVVASLSRSQ